MEKKPAAGDMFECEKCKFRVQVVQGCDCGDSCVDLKCCGEPMNEITEPAVQHP